VPRQNRVTPFGEIIATPARGTLMGNRGCIHDAAGRLTVARWRSRRWIACLLAFRGRRRPIMAPGRWTELFFLDEATALAAGHRPCAECRRADFNRFKDAWLHGNAERGLAAATSIDAIDQQLHAERVGRRRSKQTFRARLATLPDGAFVCLDAAPSEALLLWQESLIRWRPQGYGERCPAPPNLDVAVLTPVSIIRAIAAGYQPALHPSLLRTPAQAHVPG
jgi:hypothetical protein